MDSAKPIFYYTSFDWAQQIWYEKTFPKRGRISVDSPKYDWSGCSIMRCGHTFFCNQTFNEILSKWSKQFTKSFSKLQIDGEMVTSIHKKALSQWFSKRFLKTIQKILIDTSNRHYLIWNVVAIYRIGIDKYGNELKRPMNGMRKYWSSIQTNTLKNTIEKEGILLKLYPGVGTFKLSYG